MKFDLNYSKENLRNLANINACDFLKTLITLQKEDRSKRLFYAEKYQYLLQIWSWWNAETSVFGRSLHTLPAHLYPCREADDFKTNLNIVQQFFVFVQ